MSSARKMYMRNGSYIIPILKYISNISRMNEFGAIAFENRRLKHEKCNKLH